MWRHSILGWNFTKMPRPYLQYQLKAHWTSADQAPPNPSPQALQARGGLGELGAYLRPKWKPAKHHLSWFPHIRTGQSNEALKYYAGSNTDLLAPRGSAKSTWAAIAAADIIGHNPDVQILYLSHSRDIALRQSRLIKRIIELPQYQEVFPHIKPGRRWADTDWEIDKKWAGVSALDSDATLKSYGILGSVIGGRYHFIFIDDCIKSSKAIANPDIREQMVITLEEVVEECLLPGGRIAAVGTRFRRDDIHTYFDADEDWNVITTSALTYDENGQPQSYWPERIKLERLLHVQRKKPIIFLYQLQNQLPEADEDVIIKPEWIQWGVPPEKFSKLVLGVDLAASEDERGDQSAYVLVGLVRKPFQLWVLQCWYFRLIGNVDKLLLLKSIHEQYGNFELIPETNAYQRSLLGDIKTIFQNEWKVRGIRVVPTPSKGDKDERLNGISGVFANGFVHFNRNAETRTRTDSIEENTQLTYSTGLNLLVEQLTGAAEEGDDDLSDACEKAIARLQGRNKEVWSV